jgi:cytochrome c-type biogenesis protein CcmH/NrfG
MGIGFLMLLKIVVVLLPRKQRTYRFTRKQGIALGLAGTVVFGAAFFALYQQANRTLNASYYLDARERLFQPESDEEDYNWAIGLFKQELKRNPGNVPARAWLSISQGLLFIFFQSNDNRLKSDACQSADDAYRLDPTSPEAHLAKARCAALKNDDTAVDKELNDALERNPPDAMIWLAAAVTRQWRGQNEKATENYERAKQLAPNDARISLNYGHHLYELGEQKRSRELL